MTGVLDLVPGLCGVDEGAPQPAQFAIDPDVISPPLSLDLNRRLL